MNLSDHITPKIVQAIYDNYVKARKDEHRPHLGGSQIGNSCERALWYQFRHADRPVFEGRMLRLFETGDREEDRIVRNLRDAGMTVWDRDPETGKQIRFTAVAGHFALSLDGVGEGVPESGRPHTLEFKTMSEKNFGAMRNKGCEESKPIYYAQCQIGMHLSGIDRCLFIAVNKNTDEVYAERVRYDPAVGIALLAKADRVIKAEKPPARINNDPSWYECKFCTFHAVCHRGKPPEVSCRTCAHATPEMDGDGRWSCAKGRDFGKVCGDQHIFNPYAMPWPIEDAGDDWIEYLTDDGEVIRNFGGNSADIAADWVPF